MWLRKLKQRGQNGFNVIKIPSRITLLAVSKQQTPDKIRALYEQGQRAFGENYLQEALEKQTLLQDLNIEWHFIGHIQSNKTKLLAEHFSWVQSVDRLDIARKLDRYRPAHLSPLNICIQINIDHEENKSGIFAEDLLSFATALLPLKHLKLRGLMIIPEKNSLSAFKKAADLYQQLQEKGFVLDTLSMGMSDDYKEAIAAGSTMIRLGTALFGKRD